MAKNKVKIIVGGAGGRMGQTILKLAIADPELEIAGAFERLEHPVVGRDAGELVGLNPIQVTVVPDIRECIDQGQVVIDFTHPDAVQENLDVCHHTARAMVIGTTGLAKHTVEKISDASKKVAIVQAPNMSVGVNLLFRLVELVGKTLDDRYDVEVTEEHHRHKKDAPSGTALELVRLIAKARKADMDKSVTYGRQGLTGERGRGSIGIHAVRGGDTVGEHTAAFIADGERIELTHRATSREAFARGALVAAKFVAKKKNGLYNMQDVLGL
jgi:4-hydroxy-tetrahydrodipicolinate reductase